MVDIRRVEEEEERIEFEPDRKIIIVQKCPKCGKKRYFQILKFIERQDTTDKVWARIKCAACGYETTRLIPENILDEMEYEKIKERMGVE